MKAKLHDNWVVPVEDYHLFEEVQYYYNAAGLITNYEEVDMDGKMYRAVFWIEGTPKPTELIRSLQNAGE